MSTIPEPELTHEERLAVARAAEQFNRGSYFECHETLEDVWSSLRGPARDFFQGLIQVSVGHHHLSRRNAKGALGMFTKALGRFAAYPGYYFGFDLAAERSRLQATLAALGRKEIGMPERPPSWRFDGLKDADQPD